MGCLPIGCILVYFEKEVPKFKVRKLKTYFAFKRAEVAGCLQVFHFY